MATQQQHERQQPGRGQQGSETETRRQNQPGTSMQHASGTQQPSPYGHGGLGNPFAMMQRMSEEMDRMFQSFFGPGLSRTGRSDVSWWPEMEVLQRGDKLVVRADVPGLKKDDIDVELRENQICISGERKSESEEKQGQYYRSERSYGSFCRTIPLPEGAKTDTASAKFEDGVLEIEIDCPAEKQAKPRRIEVRDASH